MSRMDVIFVFNLREIRKKRGLRQSDVANMLGIPQATYSRYEIGTSKVNQDMIIKMCLVLGVTPNELLGWEQAYRAYVRENMTMKKEE